MVILSSCSTLRRGEITDVPQVVDTTGEVQVYDLSMTYKDVDFTGILLMNRSVEGKNRFVLTSPFGMTVFDIETEGNGYKVHYVISAMNHHRSLYLLWSDFSILMKPDFFKNIRYKYNVEGRLDSLERRGSITKTVMSFTNYSGFFPEDIEISHPYLKLNIKLKKLNNATGAV